MTLAVRTESESDFLSWIIDYAHLKGWKVLHIRPAQTAKGWRTPVQADGAGWPDLFMVRGDRAVALEAKSERGKLTAAQWDWIAMLANVAGIVAVLARPSMRDEIERLLA